MLKWDWRSCCCCHLVGAGSHLPISPPLPPPSRSPTPRQCCSPWGWIALPPTAASQITTVNSIISPSKVFNYQPCAALQAGKTGWRGRLATGGRRVWMAVGFMPGERLLLHIAALDRPWDAAALAVGRCRAGHEGGGGGVEIRCIPFCASLQNTDIAQHMKEPSFLLLFLLWVFFFFPSFFLCKRAVLLSLFFFSP